MGIDWKKLFGTGEDSGVYPEESFYRPDDGQGRRVPETWGDIVAGMLGQLSNISRARRNSEADALLRAFNIAQQQGPEAAQKFLNRPDLPSWFRDKVLGGLSPDTFQPGVDQKRRELTREAHRALTEAYNEAAKIDDPVQRDQFIEQQIEQLRQEYPVLADSILKTLPKGSDGHYIIPGSTTDPLLDQTVMLPNGKPMMNSATGKPYTYRDLPPAVRAKLQTDMITRQMRTQTTEGRTLKDVAPQLVSILKGTPYEAMLNQPATSFLDENGEPDQQKIHNLIMDAENAKDKAQQRRGVVYIDPRTGQASEKQDGSEGTPVSSDVYFNALQKSSGVDITPFKMEYNSLDAEAKQLQAEISKLQTDPVASASPDAQKALKAAQTRLEKIRQRQQEILQEIQRAGAGSQPQPTGPAPAGGALPPGAPAITQTQVDTTLQRFRIIAKTGTDPMTGASVSRADALKGLVRGWAGMSPQQRNDFGRNADIKPAERKWLDSGGRGEPPTGEATPNSKGPTNRPSSANAVNAAAKLVSRASTPQQRATAIQKWLVPLWSRLDFETRTRIRKMLKLTPREVSVLEPSGTPNPLTSISAAPSP